MLAALLVAGRTGDHLVETAVTVAASYGAFLLAENFHFSGVLATVTAGLVIGAVGVRATGRRLGLSRQGRVFAMEFWEFLAFIANSAVFLLIGASASRVHFADCNYCARASGPRRFGLPAELRIQILAVEDCHGRAARVVLGWFARCIGPCAGLVAAGWASHAGCCHNRDLWRCHFLRHRSGTDDARVAATRGIILEKLPNRYYRAGGRNRIDTPLGTGF